MWAETSCICTCERGITVDECFGWPVKTSCCYKLIKHNTNTLWLSPRSLAVIARAANGGGCLWDSVSPAVHYWSGCDHSSRRRWRKMNCGSRASLLTWGGSVTTQHTWLQHVCCIWKINWDVWTSAVLRKWKWTFPSSASQEVTLVNLVFV